MELTFSEKRVAKIKELKEENERLRKIITECEEDNLVLELENTEYKAKLELTKRACCETCKYRNDEDEGEVYEQFCEKCNWGTDSGIKIEKMKCDEWEAR